MKYSKLRRKKGKSKTPEAILTPPDYAKHQANTPITDTSFLRRDRYISYHAAFQRSVWNSEQSEMISVCNSP